MRAMSCMLLLSIVCFTACGCSLFKKNSGNAPVTGGGTPPPQFPGANDPLRNSNVGQPTPAVPTSGTHPLTAIPASHGTTMLAGTVTDALHRPISNAYVRPINLDDKEPAAPIDIATDASGHFIIQGVKPGASYKLIARTKRNEQLLAGTVLTSAPNVRVVIAVREELAGASTPPIPTSPTPQDTQNHTRNNNDPNPINGAWNQGATKPRGPVAGNDPLLGFNNKPVGEASLPATIVLPSTGAAIAPQAPAFAAIPNTTIPAMSIPSRPQPELPRPPALTQQESNLDTGPTRVPSCVIVGNRLESMALRDTKGQTWDYRKHGKGKLLLVDFWGTHCFYCRESMPVLNRLQTTYGSQGLEVIGIALEPGQDERKEVDAIRRQCTALRVDYRQLLGRSGSFDVSSYFRVKSVPALFLLAENGDIVWECQGAPDSAKLAELERQIKVRLRNRPF